MAFQKFVSGSLAAFVLAAATAAPLAAQTPAATGRTPWGDPDLQGAWATATSTPVERPQSAGDKALLTPQEAAEQERRALENSNRDRRDQSPGTVTDVGRAYNEFWNERGKSAGRTSLVIDPPDGRIPPLTPEAEARAAARAAARGRVPGSTLPSGGRPEGTVDGTLGGIDGRGGRADHPEDLDLNDRCLMWPTSGPPMMPTGYNSNYQIIQAPGIVAIAVEMIHEVRIIPLDGRPHVPGTVRLWHGSSRGRWEGNTLVVETTNFSDKTNFRGASEKMHLVERFTRVDADTIEYQFTVTDPGSFTKPWTAALPMRRMNDRIYEYACHEGNYGMVGILGGVRAQEKAAQRSTR